VLADKVAADLQAMEAGIAAHMREMQLGLKAGGWIPLLTYVILQSSKHG
jgi:hypothetical protein